MKILSRYLISTVIQDTLLVLLVLLGLQLFIQLVSELQDIGTRNYGLWQALVYVPLLLPDKLYQFFPMAALVGTLMGLGRLANHNELTVMRTSGVSKTKIMWIVIKAALLMLIVIVLIGEGIAPRANYLADRYKTTALNGNKIFINHQNNIWVKEGENNFFHIGSILKNGNLQNITFYQFTSPGNLATASYAKYAHFAHKHWIFSDIQQTIFQPKGVTRQTLVSDSWPLHESPHLIGLTATANEQSLPILFRYIQYRKHGGLNVSFYQFTFWQRLLQPFSVIVMICLAVPFIFGPLRSATMGLRILTGICCGFIFYILNEMFGPMSMVYQIPPILAAAIPTLLFAAIGGYLLWLSR